MINVILFIILIYLIHIVFEASLLCLLWNIIAHLNNIFFPSYFLNVIF